MRDASTVVTVLVLLAIATSASDAGPFALSTAATLVAAYAVFVLLAVVPSLHAPRVAAAASFVPFAIALELAAPGGFAWPLAAVAVAVGGSVLSVRSGARLRRTIAAVLALAFVLVPIFDSLAVASAPDWLRVPTSPLPPRATIPEPAPWAPRPDGDQPIPVLRAGALVPRRVAEASGSRPSVIDAPWVDVPAGGATAPPASIIVRVIAPGSRRAVEGRFVVVTSPVLPRDARDFDGVDIVLILDPLAADREGARALASFTRRGGLLAGPAVPVSFGVDLDRALGAAIPTENGPRGIRSLGAGRVVRVVGTAGLNELVEGGLAQPQVATVFDQATTVPSTTAGSILPGAGASASPRLSDRSLAILAAFALAAIGTSRFRSSIAVAAMLTLSVVGGVGLYLVDDTSPDARSEAYVFDLGGPGGRRTEALRVVAGPAGWESANPLRSAGGLRVRGFRVARTEGGNRLVLDANGVGWLLEDGIGTGDSDGLSTVPNPPEWALPFLRKGSGRLADVRLFAGEVPFRGTVPPGVAAPANARTLVIVPRRP